MIELSVDSLGLFLIAFMFVSGGWNAAVGPGGGVTFATLAVVLSPGVAIPAQAVVEGASGAARGWILRELVDRRFLKHFVLGGMPGFALGLLVFTRAPIPGLVLQILVGVFIIGSAWMPMPRTHGVSGRSQILLGTVTAILGLFVGGMQVVIATSLQGNGVEQRRVVATSTAAVLFQFSVKLVIFALAGFSFARHGGLIVVLATASLAGTWLGSRLSFDLPQQAISQVFRVVVTVIGGFIIGRSLTEALGPVRVAVAITEALVVTVAGVLVILIGTAIAARNGRSSVGPIDAFMDSGSAQSRLTRRPTSVPYADSMRGHDRTEMIDPIEQYGPAVQAMALPTAGTDETAAVSPDDSVLVRSSDLSLKGRPHLKGRPQLSTTSVSSRTQAQRTVMLVESRRRPHWAAKPRKSGPWSEVFFEADNEI